MCSLRKLLLLIASSIPAAPAQLREGIEYQPHLSIGREVLCQLVCHVSMVLAGGCGHPAQSPAQHKNENL